jgi:acyl-CoA synthetase (AMP-forming)/AMP-acid ligase II
VYLVWIQGLQRAGDVFLRLGEGGGALEGPRVSQLMAYFRAHPGETIKALVVLVDGAKVDESDLKDHCRAHMAHYKCPTSIEFRDELARTATGKLQKFKLREQLQAALAQG